MTRPATGTGSRVKGAFTVIELLLVVAICFGTMVVLTPFVLMTKEWARRLDCANDLRRISLGIHTYARDHNGAFPRSLGELYPRYLADAKAFNCPESRHIGTPEDPDYDYIAGLNERSAPKTSVVREKDRNHRYGENILTVDGSVYWRSF